MTKNMNDDALSKAKRRYEEILTELGEMFSPRNAGMMIPEQRRRRHIVLGHEQRLLELAGAVLSGRVEYQEPFINGVIDFHLDLPHKGEWEDCKELLCSIAHGIYDRQIEDR